MPKTTAAYFEANGSDAILPPEEMANLLLGGEPEQPTPEPAATDDPPAVDTPPAEPEKPAEPEPEPAEEVPPVETPAEPEQPAAEPKDGEKPVIIAKDGVHTIEYEKLEIARDKAKLYKEQADISAAQVEKLNATIAELTAPKEDPADAEAAQEAADKAAAVIDDLKTNDPEIYEAVKVMLDTNFKVLETKFESLQESSEDTALDIHFNEIESAHGDFEKIIGDGTVEKWIETQPSYMQEPMKNVILSGTSKEVIEMLTNYKDSLPAPDDSDAAALVAKEIADKAAAAVAAAQGKKVIPNSLSAVPAGTQAHHDPNEVMLSKSPKGQIDAYSGKSVSDIMDSMDKIL